MQQLRRCTLPSAWRTTLLLCAVLAGTVQLAGALDIVGEGSIKILRDEDEFGQHFNSSAIGLVVYTSTNCDTCRGVLESVQAAVKLTSSRTVAGTSVQLGQIVRDVTSPNEEELYARAPHYSPTIPSIAVVRHGRVVRGRWREETFEVDALTRQLQSVLRDSVVVLRTVEDAARLLPTPEGWPSPVPKGLHGPRAANESRVIVGLFPAGPSQMRADLLHYADYLEGVDTVTVAVSSEPAVAEYFHRPTTEASIGAFHEVRAGKKPHWLSESQVAAEAQRKVTGGTNSGSAQQGDVLPSMALNEPTVIGAGSLSGGLVAIDEPTPLDDTCGNDGNSNADECKPPSVEQRLVRIERFLPRDPVSVLEFVVSHSQPWVMADPGGLPPPPSVFPYVGGDFDVLIGVNKVDAVHVVLHLVALPLKELVGPNTRVMIGTPDGAAHSRETSIWGYPWKELAAAVEGCEGSPLLAGVTSRMDGSGFKVPELKCGVTAEGIASFLSAIRDGKVPKYVRSQPVPESTAAFLAQAPPRRTGGNAPAAGEAVARPHELPRPSNHLITIVGSTFDDIVLNRGRSVMLLITGAHGDEAECARLLSIFRDLADVFRHEASELIVATIDGEENEMPEYYRRQSYPEVCFISRFVQLPEWYALDLTFNDMWQFTAMRLLSWTGDEKPPRRPSGEDGQAGPGGEGLTSYRGPSRGGMTSRDRRRRRRR